MAAVIILVVPGMVAPYSDIYGEVTVFDCAKAVLLCSALTALIGWFVYRTEHGAFLLKLFLAALLLRILIGTAIFVFNGQTFFGGDAFTYDYFGKFQLEAWLGNKYAASQVNLFVGTGEGSGWGMLYLFGSLYGLLGGRNMLAIQFVNAAIGAVTAVHSFFFSPQVFFYFRVALLAATALVCF